MSKTLTPEELRQQRLERRQAKEREAKEREAAASAGQEGQGFGPEAEDTLGGGQSGTGLEPHDVPKPVFAQGRPQPMLRLEDLPEPVDAPEAQGPLTLDEEERWELCQRGLRQFKEAWFVGAKSLDIALRGRLWRRDYATAEAFISAEAQMSTSNAYRQIAGSEVAAVLATAPRLELESNDLSRTRDSDKAPEEPVVISQRAAEALVPIKEEYGAATAAAAYRAMTRATGKTAVSGKAISGIVQQLPRKAEMELTKRQLEKRIESIVAEQKRAELEPDPVKELTGYVAVTRNFAEQTKGLAEAYHKAAHKDPEATEELLLQLRDHMATAASNFPDV